MLKRLTSKANPVTKNIKGVLQHALYTLVAVILATQELQLYESGVLCVDYSTGGTVKELTGKQNTYIIKLS